MRDELESGLLELVDGAIINGKQEKRLSNTTNITFPGIDSEALLIRLSEAGIAASSGSACMTGAIEPSHVLLAMGRSREEAMSSIRLSLSRYNTNEEIRLAVHAIAKAVNELRAVNAMEEG